MPQTERLKQYDAVPVPCDRIYYDTSFNCRGEFTLQSVEDLASSITEIGRLLAPVWVQPAADVPGLTGYDYRLIAGHRRYRAATVYLKWKTIPTVIMAGLTEHQARLANLTENLERKDLNPLEEALAIKAIYPADVTITQVAKELKKDSRWVHARLRLLKLPEQVQQLVAARRVTLLDLEIICRKTDQADQIKAAEALAASKRGRGHKAVFMGEKLERSFRRRRNKAEINGKIALMLNLGIEGLAPRIAAWCAGFVTDDEINADIFAEFKKQTPSATC